MNVAHTRNTLAAVTLAGATCLLAFYTASTSADERQQFGVGVSTNVNSIYFPMRLNGLMVEPMYYYYDNIRGYSNGNGFYEENKTAVFGIGIFALGSVDDDAKVEAYWGMRFGFLSGHTDRTNASGSWQDDESGVIYEPTLGVQYFFTPRFSISADAAFTFQRSSVDLVDGGRSYLPYDHDISGTYAKVIVRGYFN